LRITVLALGSRGDVLPCVVLGKGLKAVGHQVRFATFENYGPLVIAQGLDFYPIRGDVRHILNQPEGISLAASGRNVLRMARSVQRMFGVMAESFARDLSDRALWDTEVIINQLPGGMYGYDLAETLGVPMIAAAVMPIAPTKHQPMLAFPSSLARLPGYNAFTHWLAYQLVWQGYRPAVSRWRQRTLGLPKAPLWGYARSMVERRVPVLNGFSAHVVPRPPDWGEHVHITGYWFPEEEGWQPPEDLCRFIESGPPPVFVGFGSMPMRDPERTTAIVLDALKQCGQRAVLGAGWGGMGQRELPKHVHRIEYAPYAWLFPRMSAVVHHGGSGTTAFGLRAGVPAVIVPFLFDQFYWGRRLAVLGVGPEPVPYRKLSAERLSEAIAVAVTDARMRRRAAALGYKIRAEGGVKEAVGTVQRLVPATRAANRWRGF
jgi:UDP:flavonoid glycosyltransferase YjiC (YdhE family)